MKILNADWFTQFSRNKNILTYLCQFLKFKDLIAVWLSNGVWLRKYREMLQAVAKIKQRFVVKVFHKTDTHNGHYAGQSELAQQL